MAGAARASLSSMKPSPHPRAYPEVGALSVFLPETPSPWNITTGGGSRSPGKVRQRRRRDVGRSSKEAQLGSHTHGARGG